MCCSWRPQFNFNLIFMQQITCADCSCVYGFFLALAYRRLDKWLDDLIQLILEGDDNSTLRVRLALKYYDHRAIWSSALGKPGVTLSWFSNRDARVHAVVSWAQLKSRKTSCDQPLPNCCVLQATQHEGVQLGMLHPDSARFIFFYILL